MDQSSVVNYIVETFHANITTADENLFFFYTPTDGSPPDQRFPFATLVVNDKNDTASNLSRPGIFRVNIGVSKTTFQELFGAEPFDPAKYDFTVLDAFMPHPIYGKMYWLCVLNPDKTFDKVKQLLQEAHEAAANKHKPKERS